MSHLSGPDYQTHTIIHEAFSVLLQGMGPAPMMIFSVLIQSGSVVHGTWVGLIINTAATQACFCC